MREVLEAIVAGLKEYAGFNKVILADPRYEFGPLDLPLAALSVLGASPVHRLVGVPHEFVVRENPEYPEDPWPETCFAVWRWDWELMCQLDVYAEPSQPGEQTGYELAKRAVRWLIGAGRDQLRAVGAFVRSVTPARRMVEILGELEMEAYSRWTLEFVLVVPDVAETDVKTVEEVVLHGVYEGAVKPERELVVKSE